jgi:sec-independent protein translocase protein TatA
MFGGLSMWELILIFMVVLLLFGAKRLPEIGSSLGKGIREFKGSLKEIEGELKLPPEPAKPKAPPASEPEGSEEGGDGEPRRLTTSQ